MEDPEAELLETITNTNNIIREVDFCADSINNLRKKFFETIDGKFDK